MHIHSFQIDLNWLIVNRLSRTDRFTGEWSRIIMSEGHGLKQLKSVATVSSVGASTRIDGAKMTDEDIEVLIDNLDVLKLEHQDHQEVVGYFETLDLISEAWQDIPIAESSIRSLHNVMMKYSIKDEWHKGVYKQEPGWPAKDAMGKLVEWYNKEKEVHPLVRAAVFVYDFLSMDPFQDGNGRLSRLLATLLLLKEGYSWMEYISFEHEIELRKNEYYKILMECRQNRPGENITPWVFFFIDCLAAIQQKLMQKLETKIEDISISPRIQQIRMYIEHHSGARTGEIAENLGIPLPTVKKEVTAMVASGLLVKHGSGAGTNYTAKPRLITRPDRMLKLGKNKAVETFQLAQPGSSRMIKKIVLTPLFDWVQPDEWVNKLFKQGLFLFIECTNRKDVSNSNQFLLGAFNNPYLFQPVFTFKSPIVIPDTIIGRTIYQYEYPWQVSIHLKGSVPVEDYLFDVLLVYDEKV